MNSTIKKMLMNIWITIGQKLYEKKKKKFEPHLLIDFLNQKKKKSPVNQNTNIYIYIYAFTSK